VTIRLEAVHDGKSNLPIVVKVPPVHDVVITLPTLPITSANNTEDCEAPTVCKVRLPPVEEAMPELIPEPESH
jgi:hypothetical protein